MDWQKQIPPSVPDDQNFFTYSSNINWKFVRRPEDEAPPPTVDVNWLDLSNLTPENAPGGDFAKEGLVLADIRVVSHAAPEMSDPRTLVLDANGSDTGERIRSAILSAVGPTANFSRGCLFFQRRVNEIRPVPIVLRGVVGLDHLQALLPIDSVSKSLQLSVMTVSDPDHFQAVLTGGTVVTAEDFLTMSDQFQPAFEEIRKALERPYAIIPGDYSVPWSMPMPSFLTLRRLAQTLSQRAKCLLLTGHPEAAMRELSLMHDTCRLLSLQPSNRPMTVVSALIKAAITNMEVSVVEEGLRLHAWQEPQIMAIQRQLREIHPLSDLIIALQTEQSANTMLVQIEPRSIFSFNGDFTSLYEGLLSQLVKYMPRGWMQNVKELVAFQELGLETLESNAHLIRPKQIEELDARLAQIAAEATPFRFLTALAAPSFPRSAQKCGHAQEMVQQADIACALELFRMSNGDYPESLAELVPDYIASVPNDGIGGNSLHYRRTEKGAFLLYSVGWNETDDGGQAGGTSPSASKQYDFYDYYKGDWVWGSIANVPR